MKKRIVLGMSLLILFMMQSAALADVIVSPIEIALFNFPKIIFTIAIVLGLIGIISYFLLKHNGESEPLKHIKMKKNIVFSIFVMIVFACILWCLFVRPLFYDAFIAKCSLIVLFLIIMFSEILFLCDKRRVAIVIFVIATIILILMIVGSFFYKNYCQKLYYYQNDFLSKFQPIEEIYTYKGLNQGWNCYEAKTFIEKLIENNKENMKITITYQGKEYKTETQLKKLIKELDEQQAFLIYDTYQSYYHFTPPVTLHLASNLFEGESGYQELKNKRLTKEEIATYCRYLQTWYPNLSFTYLLKTKEEEISYENLSTLRRGLDDKKNYKLDMKCYTTGTSIIISEITK